MGLSTLLSHRVGFWPDEYRAGSTRLSRSCWAGLQQPFRCESYCLHIWEPFIAASSTAPWERCSGSSSRPKATNLDFAVILLLETEEGMETVRVYDAAHGHNEMHRYTRSGGKEPGEVFHSGTLGEGMRAAISEVERGYHEMIEGWKSQ